MNDIIIKDGVVRIALTRGKYAFVDEADLHKVAGMKWYWQAGYAARRDKESRLIYMHRVIVGQLDRGMIDHIDGNGCNNRKGNLRVASSMQNAQNRKKSSNRSSIYKGVSICRKTNKWQASIKPPEGKAIFLGRFNDQRIAALAYNISAFHYFGEYAKLNLLL